MRILGTEGSGRSSHISDGVAFQDYKQQKILLQSAGDMSTIEPIEGMHKGSSSNSILTRSEDCRSTIQRRIQSVCQNDELPTWNNENITSRIDDSTFVLRSHSEVADLFQRESHERKKILQAKFKQEMRNRRVSSNDVLDVAQGG